MQTEDLQKQGLTTEQISYVMAEYGKELNPLKAERDNYKTQLSAARASLKAMDGVNVEELQRNLRKLQEDLAGKDAEIQQVKADAVFNEALKDAVIKSGARSEKAVMAFLDLDALKGSKNQAADIQAALETIKKENDYLFQSARPVPRVVATTPGPNPAVEDKKTQANEALRSLFGKE